MYEVTENGDGTKTYTRARTKATAYYRWDQGAIPAAEAFPPGFRMIAHSNDFGADVGEIGDGNNLIVECCRDGTQDCEVFDFLTFPTMKCDLMEIFFCTFLLTISVNLEAILHNSALTLSIRFLYLQLCQPVGMANLLEIITTTSPIWHTQPMER